MNAGKSGSKLTKLILSILIITWFISAAAAFDAAKLQWDKGITGTLKRNEVLSYMGYSVQVVAFNAPVESDKYKQVPVEPVEAFVGLNISKNGTFINQTMLRRGESFITEDGEFKVTATDLPPGLGKEWLYESYGPWVKLELNPRGKPRLEVTMDTEDEYLSLPNTEIEVEVVLRNTGAADALNVNMDIGTNLSLLRGSTKFHYEIIKKGTQVSETVTFSAPIITELKSFDIYANVSGYDVKDISYKNVLLKTIFVAPPPQQLPSLKKSSSAKMYLKDITMVTLSFRNNMNYELKNVSITDYVPKGFKQISNNSLRWVVDVPPNGDWYFRYMLKPIEADKEGVVYPAAKAEFKIKNEYYAIQSNRPETIVYGPRIDLTKQANVQEIDPFGTFTVTVVAVNKGTTPTKVSIKDTLPYDVTLLNGSLVKEEYMEAGKELKFSYTIRSDTDKQVRLPAVTADYFELGDRGAKISARSQEQLIRIKPPPTPEPTPPPPVEILDNYTEPSPDEVPIEEITPAGPEIVEPEPGSYQIDQNIILNLLLGCDIPDENGNAPTNDICGSVLANIP